MLTDDTLKLNININGDPARKELSALSQSTRDLTDANKTLRTEMLKLEAAGKKNSAEYNALKANYKANTTEIAKNEAKMALLRKEIGLSSMTIRELRSELKNLKKAQELTSPGTEEWKKYNAQIKATSDRLNELTGKTKSTSGMMGELKGMLPAMGFAAVAGGAVALGTKIITTRQEFEKYEAVLKNTLGSNQKAQEAMAMLTNVASELPVSLSEATEAYIKMVNRGMKPTSEEMVSMTDIAMSQGKSLDQFVEAMLDAQTGEYERLKEFGILAKKNGDEVTMSFKGQTTTIKATDEAMTSYLNGLGKLPGVAGSSAAVMDTLNGAFSNAGDATDKLLNAMGEGGLGDTVKNLAKAYASLASSVADWVEVPQADKLAEERMQANALATQLMDVNLKEEDRIKIMAELNAISPMLVENLKAESLNYDQLKQNLKQYNDEMINKIILSKKDAEIEEQNKKASEAREERVNFEFEAIKKLTAAVENYRSFLKKGYTGTSEANLKLMEDALHNENIQLEERYKIIKGILSTSKNNWMYETYWGWIESSMSKLKYSMRDEKELVETSDKLAEEKAKLMEKLGILSSNGNKSTADEETKKKLKAELEALEEKHKKEQNAIDEAYANGELSDKQHKDKLLASDLAYLNEKKALLEKLGQSTAAVEAEILKKRIDGRDKTDPSAKAIKELQAAYDKEQELINQAHANGKTNDATYKSQQLTAEINFLSKKRDLQKKYGQETLETDKALSQKIYDSQQAFNELIESTSKELNQSRINNTSDLFAQQIASENTRWEEERMQLSNRLIFKEDLSNQEIELNNLTKKLIEEREKEHIDKLQSLDIDQRQKKLDLLTAQNDLNLAEHENDVLDYEASLQAADERYQAAQDIETQRFALEVEKLKGNQLEIEQATVAHKQRLKALENEHTKAVQDANKKRNDADLGRLQVAEAVLDGIAKVAGEESEIGRMAVIAKQAAAMAITIMNLAQGTGETAKVGFPQNVPLIIGFLAQTATLIATIKNATSGMRGKKIGGYTDSDVSDDRVVDYVHANEFVATADAKRNPKVKQVLDVIDMAQRNGTISFIDLPRVISAGQGAGKRDGGYSQSSEPAATIAQYYMPPEMMSVLGSIDQTMAAIKANGIAAKLSYDQYNNDMAKMKALEADVTA